MACRQCCAHRRNGWDAVNGAARIAALAGACPPKMTAGLSPLPPNAWQAAWRCPLRTQPTGIPAGAPAPQNGNIVSGQTLWPPSGLAP